MSNYSPLGGPSSARKGFARRILTGVARQSGRGRPSYTSRRSRYKAEQVQESKPAKAVSDRVFLVGLGLVGLFYSGLVLLRHYSFETHAHDLAIFDQAVWHYSRWEAPFSSIKGFNVLGDHFTPILSLAGPFY